MSKFEVTENTNLSILELGEKQRFREAIDPIEPERDKRLGELIRMAGGISIPVVAWFDGECWWLVDGHHRRRHWLKFYAENQSFPEPAVYELKCDTEEEVCQWIEETHLNRRNMTDKQQKYLVGKLYNETKKPHGGDRKNPKKQGEKSNPHAEDLGNKRTSEAIAEQRGISKASVERAGDFAKGVDQLPGEEKEKVLSGKSELKDSEIEAMGRGKPHKAKPTTEPADPLAEYRKPFTSLIKRLGDMHTEFAGLANDEGGVFVTDIAKQDFRAKAKALQEVVRHSRPAKHKPCDGKGCKTCENRGFMRET